MDHEFQPWTGDYEKRQYIVKLHSGETVLCWPNAGKLFALDDTGREFQPEEIAGFRVALDDECAG